MNYTAGGIKAKSGQTIAVRLSVAAPGTPGPSDISITVKDLKGNPATGMSWTLALPGGDVRQGVTDKNGRISVKGLTVTGKYKLTFPDLKKAAKGAPAPSGGQPQAAQAADPPPPPEGAKAKRDAIVAKAAEFIGKVADQGGTGGKRKGWEILKDLIDTAMNVDIFGDPKAKELIPQAGGEYTSWCGIFALAMAKKAGVLPKEIYWKSFYGIQGLAQQKADFDKIQPGDIIVVEPGGVHHHAIVKSIEGDTFHTIDGNSTDTEGAKTFHSQTICEHTRQRSEIHWWYKTVADE